MLRYAPRIFAMWVGRLTTTRNVRAPAFDFFNPGPGGLPPVPLSRTKELFFSEKWQQNEFANDEHKSRYPDNPPEHHNGGGVRNNRILKGRERGGFIAL